MPGRLEEFARTDTGGARCLIVIWAAAVGVGFGALSAYENSPGPSTTTRPTRASFTSKTANPPGWRLLVAVHPRCPCTHATVENLRLVKGVAGDPMTVEALVYTPAPEPDGWRDTQLVEALRSIPAVALTPDPDGRVAERHGLLTSGAVVLYDPMGVLRFHGGVTPSRGHRGDSVGTEAIRALLAGQEPEVCAAPAFGCRVAKKDTR